MLEENKIKVKDNSKLNNDNSDGYTLKIDESNPLKGSLKLENEEEFIGINYFNEFVKMAKVNRKINRCDGIEETIAYIFNSIHYFNYFDEYHRVIEDSANTRYEDIVILNEFKDFILPRSIRFDPSDLRTKNLLVYAKRDSKFKFDMNGYFYHITNFRRYFKKDINSDFTSLDALKKHISFNEALSYMYCVTKDGERYIKRGSLAFIPIRLTNNFDDLFEDYYFDSNYKPCVLEYMHKEVFK